MTSRIETSPLILPTLSITNRRSSITTSLPIMSSSFVCSVSSSGAVERISRFLFCSSISARLASCFSSHCGYCSFSFGFKYLSAQISSPIRFSTCVHLRVSFGTSFPNPFERVMPFPSWFSSIPAPIMTGYEPPQPYSFLRKSAFSFEDKLF